MSALSRNSTARGRASIALARVCLVVCCLAVSAVHAQTYRYVAQFGNSGPGTLNFPNDVQVDPATRNIYVSDTGNNRIVVFNPAGAYVTAFGSTGSGDGQFDYPAGVGIDPVSHHVLVADYYGGRVETFSANGSYLSKFGPAENWTPCAISVRPGNRDILISTGFGASVLVYDVNQNYLGQFGSSSNFGYPCDMAVAANGGILVTDQTKNNVQVFDSGGGYVGAFGGFGSTNGKFNSPGGIVIDSVSKDIIVVDYGNSRVQTFDENGNYLGQFGTNGSGPGQFDGPNGIAMDPVSHDLFVADRGNDRIQRFASCGPTLVSLSVLPQTQALNQPVFFSASIGNVVSPSGTVSIYSGGTLVCTATTYGDPQAACSGNLTLGMHDVTAVYSGTGDIPSGCSDATVVTIVDDTMLTAANGQLLITPGDPASRLQGQPITLSYGLLPLPSPGSATGAATTQSYDGFVTFYDGGNVLAEVPLSADAAEFTNAFVGGSHAFSASYSGDATHQTTSGGETVNVIAPADDVFYGGFEVPPGT